MEVIQMSKETINIFFSNNGTRNDVRKRVINKFLEELPGTGNGDLASRHDYIVERLSDNKKIILTRPANLKNGFDFLVRVEGVDFNNGTGRCRDNPSHDDIIADLEKKKLDSPEIYKQLYEYIVLTYNCNEIDDKWFNNLNFNSGFPCDLIIKSLKWLFIEQDIRYWHYSGRSMLMSSIPTP